MAGAVEDGDHLAELGDRLIGDLLAIQRLVRARRPRELEHHVLQAPQPRRRRLLDRRVLVDLRAPHQIYGHPTLLLLSPLLLRLRYFILSLSLLF